MQFLVLLRPELLELFGINYFLLLLLLSFRHRKRLVMIYSSLKFVSLFTLNSFIFFSFDFSFLYLLVQNLILLTLQLSQLLNLFVNDLLSGSLFLIKFHFLSDSPHFKNLLLLFSKFLDFFLFLKLLQSLLSSYLLQLLITLSGLCLRINHSLSSSLILLFLLLQLLLSFDFDNLALNSLFLQSFQISKFELLMLLLQYFLSLLLLFLSNFSLLYFLLIIKSHILLLHFIMLSLYHVRNLLLSFRYFNLLLSFL
mmetsp:Transcript_20053/g.23099  ORF Transcript_20053/g.23099 Transcript_20053/m.23099 type:complete len:254 (-) Transcript_20053:419-1180(-)